MAIAAFRIVSLAAVMLLIVGGRSHAAEPTIAELVGRMPQLSASNAALDQFQCEIRLMIQESLPIDAQVGWSRTEPNRTIVYAGADRTPIAYMAEKQCMVFDVNASTVFLCGRVSPELKLGVVGDRTSGALGVLQETEEGIEIDLSKMLREPAKHAELQRAPDGLWRLICPTGRDEEIAIADFVVDDKPQLRRAAIMRGEHIVIRVTNIKTNDEVDLKWPAFPANEAFPQRIQVNRIAKVDTDQVAGAKHVEQQIIRSLLMHWALRKRELRILPYFTGVDWEQAQKNHDDARPFFLELLKLSSK